jgi:hypothetical protein
MSTQKYVYPKGDFMSGFSEGDEICEYEIACQTMVVRGMNYIYEHPEIKEILMETRDCYDKKISHLLDAMTYGIEPSGAMVGVCTTHLYYAQKHGWEKYLEEITKPENN